MSGFFSNKNHVFATKQMAIFASRNFNMKKQLIFLSLAASVFAFAQEKPKENTKEKQIEGVTITATKKAVEQKADRTIFDFSEQPTLNSGTLMEGVKKLPGLVVTDIAGIMYQGKLLSVFMDGRPLNITSNELNSFLEGLPANAVDRIEIITQPGAEFPATSGGAILNIITSKTARNYLSATYSGNYSFTNYDKLRSRTNNSLSLNAKNKLFGWQLNFGQNYRKNMMVSSVDDLTATASDGKRRGYYAKAAMTFDIGMDRLLLNYDIYHNNNDNFTFSDGRFFGVPFESEDMSHTDNLRNEAVVTYQKKFTDKAKKLDFKYSFSSAKSDFAQENLISNLNILENSSDMMVNTFKIDYSQPVKILEKGKISFGGQFEQMNFDTESRGITNLDYERQNAATYLELQASLKKFDFTLGTRAENYDISGVTQIEDENGITVKKDLIPFNKFKLFPNASIQYSFMPRVYFAMNYNKKITLPSISALNPNNSTFQNGNTVNTGNPNLRPTIFDNYEVKVSMFDYAFIGYNVNVAKEQVVQFVTRESVTDPQTGLVNDYIRNNQMNISEMTVQNFNVGIPIPFMIFTKPLKEIMQFNFNPDKINFLYVYAAFQKHNLPGMDTKGVFMMNLNSQIILPKDIKFNANYFLIPPRGNYYLFEAVKPIGNNLDITLSKKFMKDRLNVSIFANDIFNGSQMAFRSVAQQPYVLLSNKFDSRSFGISVNYKIPTKNVLAKEAPNMLNQEKKEEGGLLQQGQ